MVIPILDLKREYQYMKKDIDEAIKTCLAHQKWILGPEVEQLEKRVSQYLNVKHCIGVSSGTDALVLSLRALAIKLKGKEYFDKTDEIITTTFTFTATGDAILRSGATPVFVDIDPITFNLDPEQIKSYLTTQPVNNLTKVVGIVPVHLYGQICDMEEILRIAKEYNLFVVEDVAQAFGAKQQVVNGKWQMAGSIGNAGCFSFFPSKNLGGFGDGGMVSTNDDEIAELVRMLLKHGGKDKYNVDHIGYNARLDTIQAGILLAKFKFLDEFNEKRRKIAQFYTKELSKTENIILPSSIGYHVFHQYTIRILNGKRDTVQKYLKEKGIDTMVYYPLCLHQMKVFKERCKTLPALENSIRATKEVLSLPIEPLLTEDELNIVVNFLKDSINE